MLGGEQEIDIQEEKAWKCTNCGHTYLDKSLAERCCKPRKCGECGCDIKYGQICDSCREKRSFEKAKKMTIDEYEKEFPDHMVFYNNNYYSSIDECLEYLSGDYCTEDFTEIHHIYGTDKSRVELDADSIIVDFEENSNLEDWEVDEQGRKEFEEFVTKWNDKYGTDCYMENNTIVILISDEMKKKYLD